MNYLIGLIISIIALSAATIFFSWKLALVMLLWRIAHLLNRHFQDGKLPENQKQLAKKAKKESEKFKN